MTDSLANREGLPQPHPTEWNPIKPPEQHSNEQQIRDSLIKQGIPKEIAGGVVGFDAEEIPFVYKTDPHEVTNGLTGKKEVSELWVGTTDAIHNLEGEWLDQIPEVATQWWGHSSAETPGANKRVERIEVHRLPDGSFVQLTYRDVSDMGQLDGNLVGISLHIPKGTFRPWGGPKERTSYAIHEFRKTADEEGNVTWTADLTHTSIEGTTILNGFEQIVNFNMGATHPIKEDFVGAYRFTPLPAEKNPALLTSGGVEQEYEALLAQTKGGRAEIVESMFPRVREMMGRLAPLVQEVLARGGYNYDVMQMAVDGILNHPEKIPVFERKLSDLSRDKRFLLAQLVAKAMREGQFKDWVAGLQGEPHRRFMDDTANRNSYHLLNWFMRTAPPDANLSQWVGNAERVINARSSGQKAESTSEFSKCFDGMCTSYVERYVEYLAQKYLGNTLA